MLQCCLINYEVLNSLYGFNKLFSILVKIMTAANKVLSGNIVLYRLPSDPYGTRLVQS